MRAHQQMKVKKKKKMSATTATTPLQPPQPDTHPEVFRSCTIPSTQMERAFSTLPVPQRQAWASYVTGRPKDCDGQGTLSCAADRAGVPEAYRIRTIDTLRYVGFTHRPLVCHVAPPCATLEEVAQIAGRAIDAAGMLLEVLLARYERYGREALVFSGTVPLDVLMEAMEAQHMQDIADLAEKHEAESAAAAAAPTWSLPQELVAGRTVASLRAAAQKLEKRHAGAPGLKEALLCLFQLRSEKDPPLLLVHSRADGAMALVLCRGPAVCCPEPTQALPPGLSSLRVFEWPLLEHSVHTRAPEVLCQRRECSASAGPPATAHGAHIGATFFRTPRDGEDAATRKTIRAAMNELWEREYEPRVGPEAEQRGIPKDQLVEELGRELQARENEVKESILGAKRMKTTFRCGKCKCNYCGRECQEKDWPAHKPLCALLLKDHL